MIEDKTAFVETQVKDILYGRAGAPDVFGKRDAQGRRLIPPDGELTAARLTAPLRRVLRDRVALSAPPGAEIADERVCSRWLQIEEEPELDLSSLQETACIVVKEANGIVAAAGA